MIRSGKAPLNVDKKLLVYFSVLPWNENRAFKGICERAELYTH